MRLVWSAFALDDRLEIFDYIEEDDPLAAIEVDEAIELQAQRLCDFPDSGRPGRVRNTRELVLIHYPYILAYQVRGDTVRILRVLHTARQWPEQLPS